MEDVKSSDLLITCEKACAAVGWDYGKIFESTCYYSGTSMSNINVYEEMRKVYESQHDSIHKIVITDNPVSVQCIMEAIKMKTAYVILPRPIDVMSKLMILQDMYILFDYISKCVASNFANYKKSFCKKCKTNKTVKLKIVNYSINYPLINNFINFLNGRFKYVVHECPPHA